MTCENCEYRDLCRRETISDALLSLLITGCEGLYRELQRQFQSDEELELLDAVRAGNYTKCAELLEYVVHRDIIDVVKAVKKAKKSNVPPPSWGQEIEIDADYVDDRFKNITEEYLDGHYDGSGPWEFIIGPFRIKEFPIEFIERTAHLWEFVDYEGEMGCHLHYRPAPVTNNSTKKWRLAIRNGYVLYTLLPKLIDSHGCSSFVGFRDTVREWAVPSSLTYGYTLESDERLNYILRAYNSREYHHVTLNRNRKRTLTLEFRAFEAYPVKAWTFVKVLDYFVQNDIEVAVISDYERYRDFMEKLYDGFSTDKRITLNDIGLKSKYFDVEKEYTLQTLALHLTSTFKFDEITRLVINYVYRVSDITDHQSFFRFIELTSARRYLDCGSDV